MITGNGKLITIIITHIYSAVRYATQSYRLYTAQTLRRLGVQYIARNIRLCRESLLDKQHVACCRQHVYTRATCYSATSCPGVNAALELD